jgi:hypothetical protein
MSATAFERAMDKEFQANVKAMFGAPRGDSHLQAEIKGIHIGLGKASALYKKFHVHGDEDAE